MIQLRALVLLLLLAAPLAAEPTDWPQLRGPAQDGVVHGTALAARDSVGLALAWQQPLGSGFSSIAAVDGRVLTMFNAGEDDVLAAFDAASGDELWRYRVGDRYPATGGSSDGPLSTPLVQDGIVYAFAPAGRLFAVRLEDGKEVWSRTFELGREAVKPDFGFTTAPVLADGILVLQTGGPEGRSIVGLDPKDGTQRWSYADDTVQYQTPLAFEVDGQPMVVAVNDRFLLGLAPKTGTVLLEHEHGLEVGSAMPVALGGPSVLVHGDNAVVAYAIRKQEEGHPYGVDLLWRSPNLARSFATPVYHDGLVFGFTGGFLTALDAASGELVWKSRPPGGRGLILVDGHLAIVDPKGEMVLAAASRDGYQELARARVLDEGTYTAPAFAGGRFFARNLNQLAALHITDAAPAPTKAEQTPAVEGAFGAYLADALRQDDPGAHLDSYLADKPLPLTEDGGLVHFVYRGPAKDVGIAGRGLVGDQREVAMDPIAGTDLWVRSVRLDPAAYRIYRFNVDFGTMITDPGNPHTIEEGGDAHSELRMPAWQPPAHLREPAGPRGRLEKIEVASAGAEKPRTVTVYLPPGYDQAADTRYPLLIVNEGSQLLDKASLDRALDNLIGETVQPLVAAFIDPADRNEYRNGAADHVRFLSEELVPALEARFRLRDGRENRALMGTLGGGYMALYAAVQAPQTFAKAGAQTAFAGGDDFAALSAAAANTPPLHFYLAWDDTLRSSIIERSQGLNTALAEAGHHVAGGPVPGTPEWASWRQQTDRVLESLFPLQTEN